MSLSSTVIHELKVLESSSYREGDLVTYNGKSAKIKTLNKITGEALVEFEDKSTKTINVSEVSRIEGQQYIADPLINPDKKV